MTGRPCRQRNPRQAWWSNSAAFAMLLIGALPTVHGADSPTTRLPLYATEEDPADAEQRDPMPMTTALPWGAVGFVDNGCTGALIDSRHVLAASHCFTFDYDGTTAAGVPYLQGAWQGRLVYFPNYHPARANPPRYEIDRVIVGSRVQSDPGQPSVAADWGIGHLAAEVTDFPSLTLNPMEPWEFPDFVLFAGYPRDSTLYPNGPASYPQPAPGGYCPNFGGNCWWIPGLVDPKCLAVDQIAGSARLDNFSCLVQGGNSGSPVVRNIGAAGAATWRLTGVISGGGGFWSAARFQYAPRFATGIAVASADDGSQRTQVFAADQDLGRIAARTRTEANTSAPFAYFRDLGAVANPGSIAAFRLPNGRPQVIVANGTTRLRTNFTDRTGRWQAWSGMAGPSAGVRIIDIATAINAAGLPQLYAVGSNRLLYTRRATTATRSASWGAWKKLAIGANVTRVAAVRHSDGRQQVFAISTSGTLHSTWQLTATATSSWSGPVSFGEPALPALVDVDAALASDGKVAVFAIDQNSDGWNRTTTTGSPGGTWQHWSQWSVPLYAPQAAKPPKLDELVTVTAGNWLEGGSNTLSVVFATDRQGNIYITTQEGGAWKAWRSFYN